MNDKDLNPNKVLKAIISKENRMKDPFRVKKTVQFVITMSESEDEVPAQGSVVGEEEEADPEAEPEANASPKKSPKSDGGDSEKKPKMIVVGATDEVQDVPRKK